MNYTYRPRGVCSSRIEFDLEEGKLHNIRFRGGCDGNLKGISSLLRGMPVQEVIDRLEGIRCGGKATSCPDQIASALKAYQAEHV